MLPLLYMFLTFFAFLFLVLFWLDIHLLNSTKPIKILN